MGSLRDTLASAVRRARPEMFYYRADPRARAGLKLSASGELIDVIDPKGLRIIRLSRINAAYVVDTLNAFEYYYHSAAPVTVRRKGKSWSLIDFSTPRFHAVTGFDDFHILCPSMTEPYITTEQYLHFAELDEGDVVFDVGAYSGLTSIAFSKAVGATGRVVAFEPDPFNYETAEVNIAAHARANGLENITLSANALAAQSGKITLSAEGAMGSALASIVGDWRGEMIEVDTVTLDQAVQSNALTRVDFIKMDIEGAEQDLLLNSGAFLSRHRPKLVIEPHLIGGKSTAGPITGFLESLNYDCQTVEQHGVTTPLLIARPPA